MRSERVVCKRSEHVVLLLLWLDLFCYGIDFHGCMLLLLLLLLLLSLLLLLASVASVVLASVASVVLASVASVVLASAANVLVFLFVVGWGGSSVFVTFFVC